MTDFLDLFAGNPRSLYHRPDAIEVAVELNKLALVAGLSGKSYFRNNLAGLNTVTGEEAGDVGFVLNDSEANKGVYSTDGTTWTKVADLPAGFEALTIGTAAALDVEDLVLSGDERLTDARAWSAETVSQAEAEGGAATTRRAWTAERVRQAIAAYILAEVTKDDVGLSAVDNTADVAKPVSAAQRAAIDGVKVRIGQTYATPPGLGLVGGILALDGGALYPVDALQPGAARLSNGRVTTRQAALPPGLGILSARVSEDLLVVSAEPRTDGAFVASADMNGDVQLFWVGAGIRRQATYGPEAKQPLGVDGSFVRDTIAGQPAFGRARRLGASQADDDIVRLVIVYGQSLALGNNGAGTQYSAWWTVPASSSVLMLSSGISPLQNNHNVTLVEADLGDLVPAQGASSTPPQNNNDVAALPLALAVQEEKGGIVVAVALGKGGTPIADLSQGTTPYNNVLTWVSRAVDRVSAAYPTKSVRVEVVSFCHGEADAGSDVATYAAARNQLFADLADDLSVITGQATDPVFMVGQTATLAGGAALPSAYAAADGTHVCYGPQYALGPYVDASHLQPRGYTDLGAQMGAAYKRRAQADRLVPTAAVRTGNQVVVTFDVPVGSLAIDPSVTDDGRLGIAFRDSTASAQVMAARIINATQVLVTLSGTPTGANPIIGIADRGTGNPGRNSGARSPLCDQAQRFNPITGEWMPNRALVSEIAVS